MTATRASLRDATWWRNPNVSGSNGASKYHAVADDAGVSGCGIPTIASPGWHRRHDETVPAANVAPRYRCGRPGCRRLWPAFVPVKRPLWYWQKPG